MGAIWATFVIEAVAMIALFVPRLKRFGMMIGIPFHVIIGFTGYACYKDFSTIVLVMYALFLPREALRAGLASAAAAVGGEARALQLGRLALMVLVALYLVTSGVLGAPASAIPTDRFFMPFFAAYALAFYAFAIACTPRDGGTALPRGAPRFGASGVAEGERPPVLWIVDLRPRRVEPLGGAP